VVDNRRLAEMEAMIYEKLRQKAKGNDDEGKTLMLAFRQFDANKSGDICI